MYATKRFERDITMTTKIITDTAADISAEEAKRYDVEVIRLPVAFGDQEFDGDMDEFWKNLLAGKIARTSQPSPDVFRARFEQAKEAGEALVCILISSRFSATYESACRVRDEVGYEHIRIVDSRNASVAEKMSVFEACRLRDAGMESAEIATALQGFAARVRLYACMDTLKYLVRGGRISKTAFRIGTALNIKPIISILGGEIHTYKKCFGMSLACAALADKLASEPLDPDYPVYPIYSYEDKNCLAFVEKAEKRGLPADKSLRMPIGATIATHIGPYACGVVYVVRD